MTVTAIVFTRSHEVPAGTDLAELPIEAAASAHLDHDYLAARRVRAVRLPPVPVDFLGRSVTVHRRAFHYPRLGVLDVAVEIDDEDAVGHLARAAGSSSAASAELFTDLDDRISVVRLLDECVDDALSGRVEHVRSVAPIVRVVFHRDPTGDGAAKSLAGLVPSHQVTSGRARLDVRSDTTVLAEARVGYTLLAGMCSRAAHVARSVVAEIDGVVGAAAVSRDTPAALLARAAGLQERALLVKREIATTGVLSDPLSRLYAGIGAEADPATGARARLDDAIDDLTRLVRGLHARAVADATRTGSRAAAVALLALATLIGVGVVGLPSGVTDLAAAAAWAVIAVVAIVVGVGGGQDR